MPITAQQVLVTAAQSFLDHYYAPQERWLSTHTPVLGSVCIFAQRRDSVVVLAFSCGVILQILHKEECCEEVWLEDITGDLNDLVGHPIQTLDVRSQEDPSLGESGSWTFITLRSNGGSVDMRWCGTSNGYYSERPALIYWAHNPPITLSNHDTMDLMARRKTHG